MAQASQRLAIHYIPSAHRVGQVRRVILGVLLLHQGSLKANLVVGVSVGAGSGIGVQNAFAAAACTLTLCTSCKEALGTRIIITLTSSLGVMAVGVQLEVADGGAPIRMGIRGGIERAIPTAQRAFILPKLLACRFTSLFVGRHPRCVNVEASLSVSAVLRACGAFRQPKRLGPKQRVVHESADGAALISGN